MGLGRGVSPLLIHEPRSVPPPFLLCRGVSPLLIHEARCVPLPFLTRAGFDHAIITFIMEFLIGGPIPPLRRDLEMTSTVHDGKPMLILSDIVGLQEETFLVSPGAVLIASLFDGKKKTSEIQAELTKHKGRSVSGLNSLNPFSGSSFIPPKISEAIQT